MAEEFDLNDLPESVVPTDFELIANCQLADKSLQNNVKKYPGKYSTKSFRGSDIICRKGKFVVPEQLEDKIIEWYHHMLCHAGMNRTEQTIKQHYVMPDLRNKVNRHVETCDTCQKNKRQRKKYGHLPPKVAEDTPWQILCVDLIGPYTIKRKNKRPLKLKCLTLIDPATSWFEIVEFDDKRSDTVANLVEQTWLCRYPWPEKCIFDHGSEFIGQEFQELMTEEYKIKPAPAGVRNPQANSILERIHQVVGNMLRTFELEERELDEQRPFAGILSAVAWAIRSTYHTTLEATPGQLVFGRDMILNVQHIADWHYINSQKNKKIKENNKRENAKRLFHKYKAGDKILLQKIKSRKLARPVDGPFKIIKVHTNGTVTIQRRAVTERVNLRRIQPYLEKDDDESNTVN